MCFTTTHRAPRRKIFAVPRSSRRTKPFVDHVLSFSYLDGKVWFRNYQIVEPAANEGASELALALASKGPPAESKKRKPEQVKTPTLTEIGPRFVLVPIKIFEGSFGGATLFDNPGEFQRISARPIQRLTAVLCRNRVRLAKCCPPRITAQKGGTL